MKKGNFWGTVGLIAGAFLLLATVGALNGGTALSTSAWDAFATWEKGLLSSSFVEAGALLVVVWGIWQAAHGKGFSFLSLTIGIIAVAVLGPTVITQLATATRPATSITVVHQAPVPVTAHQVV